MKKSPLILALSAALVLTACNSDDPTPETMYNTKVQAFDGAVNGLAAHFKCTDGSTGVSNTTTDGYGYAIINHETFLTAPETCSVEFKINTGGQAIDMSNGKDMSNVVYRIPKGLLETGSDLVSANPFTTLLDEYATENTSGQTIAELQTQLLGDLGFNDPDSPLTDAQKTELFSNPEKVLNEFKESDKESDKESYSVLVATTAVLSDLLVASESDNSISATDIAKSTDKVAEATVNEYPDYPMNDSGEEIYIDVSETTPEDISGIADGTVTAPTPVEKPVTNKPDPENPPVTPEKPSTGTGTGSGSDGGVGA
jgi:hypothetical protein